MEVTVKAGFSKVSKEQTLQTLICADVPNKDLYVLLIHFWTQVPFTGCDTLLEYFHILRFSSFFLCYIHDLTAAGCSLTADQNKESIIIHYIEMYLAKTF